MNSVGVGLFYGLGFYKWPFSGDWCDLVCGPGYRGANSLVAPPPKKKIKILMVGLPARELIPW